MSNNTHENISFSLIEEVVTKNNLINTESIMNDYDINETLYDVDTFLPEIINYQENFTVKELFFICEYYGISKELKNNKCNKRQIIEKIVYFEANPSNEYIVFRRKNMWFYMNEIKTDKFMKKYVLW
jgi:uncharacterized protein YfkK (UPF0435 family)